MSIEEDVTSLRQIKERISQDSRIGTILLVDLADSTKFKSTNTEDVWVSRLFLFRETVSSCLPDVIPKYLGDGILCFGDEKTVPPHALLKSAESILTAIDKANTLNNYRGDYRLQVRIVIGYGRVHLFDKTDPQGEAVDKVFRCEKYVPASCIAVTEDINNLRLNVETRLIGSFRLKGLGERRHQLFLLNPSRNSFNAALTEVRKSAVLHEFWNLGENDEGKIFVVGGHIPPQAGDEQETLQQGDKDAIVGVVTNLATVGRISDTIPLTSNKATPYLSENLICVGGPYWNSASAAMLREIRSPFVFEWDATDQSPILHCSKSSSSKYHSHRVNGKLKQDYGFLGRFRNPRNPSRHVIVICGIETPSVAGVVGVFGRENPRLLELHEAIMAKVTPQDGERGAFPDFFCLIRFSVDSCEAVPPTLEEQRALIVMDWLKDHSGQLQQDPPG